MFLIFPIRWGMWTAENDSCCLTMSSLGQTVWPESKCLSLGSTKDFLGKTLTFVCLMSSVSKWISFSISFGSSVTSVSRRLKYLSEYMPQMFFRWRLFKPLQLSKSSTLSRHSKEDDGRDLRKVRISSIGSDRDICNFVLKRIERWRASSRGAKTVTTKVVSYPPDTRSVMTS
ncbi:Os11g0654000 [Oryza sativa Japonica Group]|uniref:Os11g0654000 protein n=2 Tax=Oryza sativa subsp. japonica TaxID=39947 RepID=Q0IRB9_ORYSJ|nr:hypothetical protein EE612_056937 [Oryza sativa]BAF28746.1 Os11g0654000 [Oryza sativa Japonica Group]BAT15090.1 Os11g0654000 [Oryza sativa Japonica Group]|eukprot:NP_001068383.1 Os11g0654000 [Oryza sativa Japonica Group]